MSRAVLVVEPDVDALGALASELRARGLTVSIAADVDGALDRVRKARPDALLISEDMDQARVFQALDADGQAARLPRFVLKAELGDSPDGQVLPRGDPEAIARRMFLLPSKPTSAVVAEKGDFRGDIQQVGILDLLQLLSMNRRTGSLNITTASGAGEVRVVAGEVVDAVFRRLEGEKALYRLLAESEGNFAFVSGSGTAHRRVETPTSMLLMEGMRQIDEVRRLRDTLHAEEDALLAAAAAPDDADEVATRIVEALQAPRALDELLDDLPGSDLGILERLEQLMSTGTVRRVARGALRVELADADRMGMLAAVAGRLSRTGFSGNPRIVIAAVPRRLGTITHAVGRIADAILPAESPPAAPVPYLLATLRLGESLDLDVVGLPLLEAYSPLWSIALGGTGALVRLDPPDSELLDELCAIGAIPVVDAGAELGEVDEADPRQVAALVRSALEAVAAR